MDAAALARRAATWNASADLALTLSWLRARLGLADAAAEWLARALGSLPATGAPGSRPSARFERPLPGLDVRPSALRGLPRWLWPPRERFARPEEPASRRCLRRATHVGGVLVRVALLGAAAPLAWLASRARSGVLA
jgi:hypothetical protein